jgi:hypothetical protein
VNSRRKGKDGEQELCHFLADTWGIEARRAVQYRGTRDSADLVTSIPRVAIDAKRRQALNVHAALEKLQAEAGDLLSLIAWRKNHGEWLAVCRLIDLPALSDAFATAALKRSKVWPL